MKCNAFTVNNLHRAASESALIFSWGRNDPQLVIRLAPPKHRAQSSTCSRLNTSTSCSINVCDPRRAGVPTITHDGFPAESGEYQRNQGLSDEGFRQILVQLQLHEAKAGVGGTGRSSPAAAAANAITARKPSGFTVGYSARICVSVAPSASEAKTVRTGTRVPLMTRAPPHNSLRRSKKAR